MASKKDIKNLVDGIVGVTAHENNTDVPKEVINNLGITEEMENQLNTIRRAKVGRPKGTTRTNKNPYEGRATFVVDMRLIRKIKYISLVEGRLLKDIIGEAMSEYIERWEDDNTKIELPK